MNEIPILIDPALEVDGAALMAAWERHPQARQWGRLEERSGPTFGVVELVVIPVLGAIGSGLIVEGIKQMVEEQQRKANRPTEIFAVVQLLPDGGEAIVVQPKPE